MNISKNTNERRKNFTIILYILVNLVKKHTNDY